MYAPIDFNAVPLGVNAAPLGLHSVRLGAALDIGPLLQALVYSAIGIVLFGLVFFLIVKIAPFSIRKEIEDDQNTALGIIIGSVIIGISLIISAAVHG